MVKKKKKKNIKKAKSQKKFSLFYKVSFSVLLLLFIALFYSVVLVSKPRSISFINNKIESEIKKNFGPSSGIDDAKVNFTYYGALKISADNVRIQISSDEKKTKNQLFLVPNIEAEISIFDLLLFNPKISRIKFTSPTIIIGDLLAKQDDIAKVASKDLVVSSILSNFQQKKYLIKDIEISNAKLFLLNFHNRDSEIFAKKIHIITQRKGEKIYFSTRNKFNFSNGDVIDNSSDISLNSNCELSNILDLKCDVIIDNLALKNIANFDVSLKKLEKINSKIYLKSSFTFQKNKISNLTFDLISEDGEFLLDDVFDKKMSFKKIDISGQYDAALDNLNLSKINVNFNGDKEKSSFDPVLDMSLSISKFLQPKSGMLDFTINLKETSFLEIKRYWPNFLKNNRIYPWLLKHVIDGKIRDSFAKFSIVKGQEKKYLKNISAGIDFSSLGLDYDKRFPNIKDVDGYAAFDKKSMDISIYSGKSLQGKIFDAKVKIDDFKNSDLFIRGKIKGKSSDVFEHISHGSDFAQKMAKYFNGNSLSNFELIFPLKTELKFKDFYMKFDSILTEVNSPYSKGEIRLNSSKDINSNKFINEVDFTQASLNFEKFDIFKKFNIDSFLKFNLVVNENKVVDFEEINFFKSLPKNKTAKISGNFSFVPSKLELLSANIENRNFGKNNYSLSYKANNDKASESLALKGKEINLGSFLGKSGDEVSFANIAGYDNKDFLVSVEKVWLANNKDIDELNLYLGCYQKLCHNFSLSAKYQSQKDLINIKSKSSSDKKKSKIKGKIYDIGYLSDSLGISKLILGGKAKITAINQFIDGKQELSGEVKTYSDFTVFENEAVKKLNSDNLYSQIKDKIFSSGKTIFNSSLLNFSVSDSNLKIDSFIAHNYKIGVSAKGKIDLSNRTYKIRGMIIPGYLVNNLFGIGKIPIIGNIISSVLTGGEEGGGVFGLKYNYEKLDPKQEAVFKTNKMTSFVPATIQNLFD